MKLSLEEALKIRMALENLDFLVGNCKEVTYAKIREQAETRSLSDLHKTFLVARDTLRLFLKNATANLGE